VGQAAEHLAGDKPPADGAVLNCDTAAVVTTSSARCGLLLLAEWRGHDGNPAKPDELHLSRFGLLTCVGDYETTYIGRESRSPNGKGSLGQVVVTSGVARIWCQWARRSRRRRREHRGAKGTEWGRVWGGVSAPQLTRGSGERRELPSGVRDGAPAAIAFSAYFRPPNASGSEKNTILLPKV